MCEPEEVLTVRDRAEAELLSVPPCPPPPPLLAPPPPPVEPPALCEAGCRAGRRPPEWREAEGDLEDTRQEEDLGRGGRGWTLKKRKTIGDFMED